MLEKKTDKPIGKNKDEQGRERQQTLPTYSGPGIEPGPYWWEVSTHHYANRASPYPIESLVKGKKR